MFNNTGKKIDRMEPGEFMFKCVMIVDDTKIDRYVATHVIRNNRFSERILEFDMATRAIDYLEQNQEHPEMLPEVILLDIRMPELDGINALQLIRKEYDELRIVVLSMYDDREMVSKMMEMGANAYLTKTTDPNEIYEAILTCMNDDFYFNDLVNKAVMGKLMQKKNVRQIYADSLPVTFSEKEIKILQLLSEDKTTEEISKIIFLSPRTIETIRQNMKSKVNAKTIGGLIMYAMRNKLIE